VIVQSTERKTLCAGGAEEQFVLGVERHPILFKDGSGDHDVQLERSSAGAGFRARAGFRLCIITQ